MPVPESMCQSDSPKHSGNPSFEGMVDRHPQRQKSSLQRPLNGRRARRQSTVPRANAVGGSSRRTSISSLYGSELSLTDLEERKDADDFVSEADETIKDDSETKWFRMSNMAPVTWVKLVRNRQIMGEPIEQSALSKRETEDILLGRMVLVYVDDVGFADDAGHWLSSLQTWHVYFVDSLAIERLNHIEDLTNVQLDFYLKHTVVRSALLDAQGQSELGPTFRHLVNTLSASNDHQWVIGDLGAHFTLKAWIKERKGATRTADSVYQLRRKQAIAARGPIIFAERQLLALERHVALEVIQFEHALKTAANTLVTYIPKALKVRYRSRRHAEQEAFKAAEEALKQKQRVRDLLCVSVLGLFFLVAMVLGVAGFQMQLDALMWIALGLSCAGLVGFFLMYMFGESAGTPYVQLRDNAEDLAADEVSAEVVDLIDRMFHMSFELMSSAIEVRKLRAVLKSGDLKPYRIPNAETVAARLKRNDQQIWPGDEVPCSLPEIFCNQVQTVEVNAFGDAAREMSKYIRDAAVALEEENFKVVYSYFQNNQWTRAINAFSEIFSSEFQAARQKRAFQLLDLSYQVIEAMKAANFMRFTEGKYTEGSIDKRKIDERLLNEPYVHHAMLRWLVRRNHDPRVPQPSGIGSMTLEDDPQSDMLFRGVFKLEDMGYDARNALLAHIRQGATRRYIGGLIAHQVNGITRWYLFVMNYRDTVNLEKHTILVPIEQAPFFPKKVALILQKYPNYEAWHWNRPVYDIARWQNRGKALSPEDDIIRRREQGVQYFMDQYLKQNDFVHIQRALRCDGRVKQVKAKAEAEGAHMALATEPNITKHRRRMASYHKINQAVITPEESTADCMSAASSKRKMSQRLLRADSAALSFCQDENKRPKHVEPQCSPYVAALRKSTLTDRTPAGMLEVPSMSNSRRRKSILADLTVHKPPLLEL